jgi:hypothetical protein
VIPVEGDLAQFMLLLIRTVSTDESRLFGTHDNVFENSRPRIERDWCHDYRTSFMILNPVR